MTQFEKIQQKIWRVIYKIFPFLEKTFLVFHKKDRQRFHLGWLHPEKSLADLKKHLAEKWGFGNHFIAWEDTDQVLSWRKLTSFKEQFHLNWVMFLKNSWN